MQEFFKGKIQEFWAGSVVGLIAGIKFLSADLFGGIGLEALEYLIRFIAVIIFSLTSGIMTVVAKDVATHLILPWLKKKYKQKSQDNES